jgi:hypothetical protein
MTFTTSHPTEHPATPMATPMYPQPAGGPVWAPTPQSQPFPATQLPPPRPSTISGQRQVAAVVAAVAIAAGAYYFTQRHSSSPTTGGQGSQGQGGSGGGSGQGGSGGGSGQGGSGGGSGQGGSGGGTVTAWPLNLSAFVPLIGSAPGTTDGWNSSPCTATQPSDPTVVIVISCSEPDNVTVKLIEVANADTITQLVAQAPANGGVVNPWSTANGPTLGQTITFADANPADKVTTFNAYPTVIVDLAGSSDAASLDAIWASAPLPH